MNSFNTLEITIQRKLGDTYPVISEYRKSGELLANRKEGNFCLTTDDLNQLDQYYLGLFDSNDLDESVNQSQRDREYLRQLLYGQYLGKLLFRDSIGQAFATAYNNNEDLRVLLFIEAEDAEINNLRWEKLCALMDGEWRFLRRDQRAFYSLYIPSIADRRFLSIGTQDLRMLALVASPTDSRGYGLDKFDVQATVDSLRRSLGDIPCDLLAYGVEGAIGKPTLQDLEKQLTKKYYTLLHIVCHGHHEDNITKLYWTKTDESNKTKVITGNDLTGKLKNIRGLPHLTFFCTCESAKTSGVFGGLAGKLVKEVGMPAVIAMTEAITIPTAEILISSFYQHLREHGWVDRALDEATTAVSEHDHVPELPPSKCTKTSFKALLRKASTRRHITIRTHVKLLHFLTLNGAKCDSMIVRENYAHTAPQPLSKFVDSKSDNSKTLEVALGLVLRHQNSTYVWGKFRCTSSRAV